jgi:hypothetical protein
MPEFTPEQLDWLKNEAPKWMAAQKAHVQEVADREQQRRREYMAAHPSGPLSDDDIRGLGGYLLMDSQWQVAGWPGIDDTNTPENRRNIINSMAEAGTVLPFTRDSEIAGYFPAAKDPGSVFAAIQAGNGLVAGDPNFNPSTLIRGLG